MAVKRLLKIKWRAEGCKCNLLFGPAHPPAAGSLCEVHYEQLHSVAHYHETEEIFVRPFDCVSQSEAKRASCEPGYFNNRRIGSAAL